MELLLKRDGFPIVECPTNLKHVQYLKSLELVQGISLNSNLYSNNESQDKVQEPQALMIKPKVGLSQSKLMETSQSKKKLVRNNMVQQDE